MDSRSFATEKSIGLQLLTGVNYDITENLFVSSELRYTRFGSLDLNTEGGLGQANGMDYTPHYIQPWDWSALLIAFT